MTRFGFEDDERVKDILLKVEYHEPGDLLADYLTELGRGGLFIRTDAAFHVGQKLSFSLSFPGLVDPIPLEGTVRYLGDGTEKPGGEPGVAVEIMADDAERIRALERLLRRLRIQRAHAEHADGEPFRVLLVEDNDFVHDLFQHALKKFHRQAHGGDRSLEIVRADDGREALEKLADGHVDLALVDHFLPVLSGSDVVRRMRADPALREIPVLVVSVGGDDVREEALRAGADLFIHKPVLLTQLLNTLGRLLGTVSDPAAALEPLRP